MATERSTSDTWGAAPRQTPGRRIAIAVAVGIAGAGATAVYAASDATGSGGTSTQSGGPGGGMGGPPDGGPGGMGALARALHGEYVVSDGDGGYTTELLQNGEVTAISDTSVTVTADESGTAATVTEAGQMGQAPPGN